MKSISILSLGDSYTIGEGVRPEESYPYLFYQYLLSKGEKVEQPEIIAKTGWTSGELLGKLRISPPQSIPCTLVFLLIGVNNQYRGLSFEVFQNELKQLFEKSLGYAGNLPRSVSVLSIPDYAYTPFGQKKDSPAKISGEIDQYNAYKKQLAEEYAFHFIDITPVSRQGLKDPELITNDDLHPSAKMYELWVEEIIRELRNTGCVK